MCNKIQFRSSFNEDVEENEISIIIKIINFLNNLVKKLS